MQPKSKFYLAVVVSIILVAGAFAGIQCQSSFHKQSGVDAVAYLQSLRPRLVGYDEQAQWYTRQSYIITDSAAKNGRWSLDTVFLIHVPTADTLKDSSHHPIFDSLTHKPKPLIKSFEILGKFVQIIRLPKQ